jgi:dolichol-phosphate mannosyltransferase
VALARLGRVARREPPLTPRPELRPARPVSVVVPARDEADRIGPLAQALVRDVHVAEVVVVDDESTDRTAPVALAAGARVVAGRPLPDGWVGKPWALQQGLEAATGHWVVTLDADVVPRPGFVGALVAAVEEGGGDWLSAGGRFRPASSVAGRLRHPAMLATLVYRFGPPGTRRPVAVGRVQANGQCTVTRRAVLAAAGGYEPAAAHPTDDVALARSLARRGWRVGFLDGTALFEVDLAAGDWSRSLALRDVTTWPALVADLAVVWLAQALPLPRLLLRRGDVLDAVLVLVRLGLVAGTARAYARPGIAHWLSPLADVPVAAGLTRGVFRRSVTWRGRVYGGRRRSAAR